VVDRQKAKEAGARHEKAVLRFVQDAVGDRLLVSSKWPVIGSAGQWDADITVNGPGDFDTKTKTGTLGPLIAVVECKFSKLGVSGGSYSNEVERGYALLNYVKWESERTKLFLVMNRLPKSGETPRDPKALFDKMGARFIDFGSERDREFLRRDMIRLQ
jgi:hypothetical protein